MIDYMSFSAINWDDFTANQWAGFRARLIGLIHYLKMAQVFIPGIAQGQVCP